ncbi:MAG: FAD-dependent oxidoreductase [Pseudohongiella sp.]|nr:FAD-dependent oxidoreductase [Pseudohongiella sp.]
MEQRPKNESYWNDTARQTNYPTLSADLETDIVIIGGGIVGVTTARLLADQGIRVVVLEAQKIGRQATGRSTAKVTSQHGLLYQKLEHKFNLRQALIYAEAQEYGLAEIRRLTEKYNIDCDLEQADAYTYTCLAEHRAELEKEAGLAEKLGLPASLVKDTELPFQVVGAVLYERQASFHPTRYVIGLAETLAQDGCEIYENSAVLEWEPNLVKTRSGSVKAKHVVMATHLPLGMVGGYYTRAFPDAEPVIAAPIKQKLTGMYINVETPSYSIRTHQHENGQTYAIVTGTRYKPGDTVAEQKNFADIENWLRQNFGAETISHRWTNEDYTSMDSAPFVGWSSTIGEDYLVATGFAGWGLTNGTAAAMMIRDLIMNKDNPWQELFNAKRIKPLAGGAKVLKESAAVVANLAKGHLGTHPQVTEDLLPGEAGVRKYDGDKFAVYRDEEDQLHIVSAVCTHMGCVLGWNATDKTWDCSCHGSRFALDGTVLHGPAVEPLQRYR